VLRPPGGPPTHMTRCQPVRETNMPVGSMGLYKSPSGDRWFLVHEPGSARVCIRHEPNPASGGEASMMDIGEFLAQPRGPQHDELLRLIGSLVNQAPIYR